MGVWDLNLRKLQEKREIYGWVNRIMALAYSFDGTLLASASDDEVVLWDSLAVVKLKHFDVSTVRDLYFSSDASILYTTRGPIELSSNPTSSTPHSPVWFIEDDWLLQDGVRRLWLHPNYRPDAPRGPYKKLHREAYVGKGKIVAIVHLDQVSFLELALDYLGRGRACQ